MGSRSKVVSIALIGETAFYIDTMAKANMKVHYRDLQEIKDTSPSRKHGLTEEQERYWKRAAVDLIINMGIKLNM